GRASTTGTTCTGPTTRGSGSRAGTWAAGRPRPAASSWGPAEGGGHALLRGRVRGGGRPAGAGRQTDDWVRTRTGIRERRLAGPGEPPATMPVRAARQALTAAGLSPRDLDLIVCATTTPDHLLPATACLVQQQLAADRAGAFDLNAACSGFLYGLA